MNRQSMMGKRIYPNEDGWLPPQLNPGEYGRQTCEDIEDEPMLGWWIVCAPDGSVGTLNPHTRTIVEHEDGTISVYPSLDYSKHQVGAWHGWLEKGYFRSC